MAVSGKAANDLRGLLGAYYPSLPRLLECHPHENGMPSSLLVAESTGEPLEEYCRRVGPLPVPLACTLVARLAVELELLGRTDASAAAHLNPLWCVVGLWEDEFLHLKVCDFDLEGTVESLPWQPVRLLQVCRMLLSGGQGTLPDAVAANVPSMLLMRLRSIGADEVQMMSLSDLRNLLLDAAASQSRTIRGTCLDTHLIAHERLLPHSGGAVPPRCGTGMVRLSRFLAHRGALGKGEIQTLMERVEAGLNASEGKSVLLNPRHIWIKLPPGREASDAKNLDMRLDSSAGFTVSVETGRDDEDWASSPVTALEAEDIGLPFEDLRRNLDKQMERLSEVLLGGCHGLRAYDASCSGEPLSAQMSHLSRPVTMADAEEPPSFEDVEAGVPESAPPEAEELVESQAVEAVPDTPEVKRRLRPIILTVGSGGTGKSMLARLLYEFAGLERWEDVALFDCDVDGNRDFHKIHPEKIQTVGVAGHELVRRLVGEAAMQRFVLADLPSSCLQHFASELNPDIIHLLHEEDGVDWLPLHLLTARASSVPVIQAWRQQVFGELPAVIVVSQKDGPVPAASVDKVLRVQDMVVRLPALDAEMAAAVDSAAATWEQLLHPSVPGRCPTFTNPLLRLQLKKKRDEFEKALRPLVDRLLTDPA